MPYTIQVYRITALYGPSQIWPIKNHLHSLMSVGYETYFHIKLDHLIIDPPHEPTIIVSPHSQFQMLVEEVYFPHRIRTPSVIFLYNDPIRTQHR
jgi:hypothetical protein